MRKLQRRNTKVADRGRITGSSRRAPVVRGPQAELQITATTTRNQMDRIKGRRPVVSIRLEPKMLDALDRVARSRPYGWAKEPTPRSMLIEEALNEWATKHDPAFKAWRRGLGIDVGG